MLSDSDRRRMLRMSLLAAAAGVLPLGKLGDAFARDSAHAPAAASGGIHDFDFFVGTWQMRHRRLKERLVGSNEWEEFDGVTHARSMIGGICNLNDSIVNRASGTFRSLGLRAFDAKTGLWGDWYLSARDPHKIDVPGFGRFENGIGTFLSDDVHQGTPVKVRGLWTPYSSTSLQWEQAFSTDGGKTWETNWVMRYKRTA